MRAGTSKTNKESYEPSPKKVITKMTGNIYKGCKEASKTFLTVSSRYYILPTVRRLERDGSRKYKSDNPGKARKIGFALGKVGYVVQGLFYFFNLSEHIEYLLLPVLTNVASAGCEEYRSTELGIIEKHKDEMVDQIKS